MLSFPRDFSGFPRANPQTPLAGTAAMSRQTDSPSIDNDSAIFVSSFADCQPRSRSAGAEEEIGESSGRAARKAGTLPSMGAGELIARTFDELSPEEQHAHNLQAVEQAQDEIDVDSSSSTSDAGYESDSIRSAGTSLRDSVQEYAWENGRRYHRFREGAYNFPNDDSEQDREDMKHAMMLYLCQTLHFAPIGPTPQRIIDMGTGTGLWAIEMGDLYPMAEVIGVDLSPIQPSWVPPNVRFTVDDLESTWLRPTDHFDYVHSRHIVMAIKDWPNLLRKTLEHLKPGGWLELQEIYHYPQCHDGSMTAEHPVARFWSLIVEALGSLGVNCEATLLLADMMTEAGFVNVSTRIFHIPIGTWPRNKVLKLVGLYWRTILTEGLEPIALGPLTRGLKWSKEQVDVLLNEAKQGYLDGSCHSHMPLYIICGQKPGEGIISQ